MLKRVLPVLAVVLMSAVVAADLENPYVKANVGDWTEYETKSKAGGMEMTMTMKQTVAKKTPDEATMDVETKTSMPGLPADIPPMKSSYTINLKEKYDPQKAMAGQAEDYTVKELGKGTEKVTVGGKSYDTQWVETEVTMKIQGQPMVTKAKVWTSPEVPMGGMVKMESDTTGMGKTTMELKGFGKN